MFTTGEEHGGFVRLVGLSADGWRAAHAAGRPDDGARWLRQAVAIIEEALPNDPGLRSDPARFEALLRRGHAVQHGLAGNNQAAAPSWEGGDRFFADLFRALDGVGL
jgi:hypothetical protein